MGLISIGGLGSGLDVKSIIDALVSVERAPKQNSLDRLEAKTNVTLTGLGGLKSALDELSSAALDLSLSSSFSKRSVTLSSETYFSASATSDASAGQYAIEVTALAQGSRHETSVFTGGATTTFGDGTLTFTIGSDTFDVDIEAADTLSEIRDKINSATDNDFVSVNLLNNVTSGADTGSILIFNSTTTGQGNDLAISYTGDAALADLAPGTATENATDAQIEIDGLVATSSSNTFTDVIQGVTIEAKQVNDVDTTEDLTIALDTANTKTLITTFVEAYNAFIDVTKELGSANQTAPGILLGDYTLRQISSRLRNFFVTPVSSISGDFNNLSAIGISTNQDGKLEIDGTTLDSAISSNFEDFDDLFSGTDGFATNLRDLISDYTGSSGVINGREQTLNQQLDKIADDRLNLELRIEALQTRLTNQFAAMDAIVAQLNNTQSYLKQQFENLPGFSRQQKDS